MTTSFNMATMPQRLEACLKTIESVYDQVPKDIDKFYTRNVTNKVVNLYKKILK